MVVLLTSAYEGTVRNRARVIFNFRFLDFLFLVLVTPLRYVVIHYYQ